MFEEELRQKGLLRAPERLDAPVMHYARDRSVRGASLLESPWVWRAAGFVPLLDWALFIAALLRGQRIRIVPVMPGIILGGQT